MNENRVITPQIIEDIDVDPLQILSALHRRAVENTKLLTNVKNQLADAQITIEAHTERITELLEANKCLKERLNKLENKEIGK